MLYPNISKYAKFKFGGEERSRMRQFAYIETWILLQLGDNIEHCLGETAQNGHSKYLDSKQLLRAHVVDQSVQAQRSIQQVCHSNKILSWESGMLSQKIQYGRKPTTLVNKRPVLQFKLNSRHKIGKRNVKDIDDHPSV